MIKSSILSHMLQVDIVFFHQVCCKSGLTQMDFGSVRGKKPLEVGTKKPFNRAHEFNCNQVLERGLEFFLDRWIFQEVDEVVDI